MAMKADEAIQIAKDTLEDETTVNDLEGLVGIDPETGDFDINLVPEDMRDAVIQMAEAMSPGGELTGRNRAERRAAKKAKRLKGKNRKR